MAWEDRLQEAAYRSPNGTRTVFLYGDVSRTVEKKTAEFNYPDVDGSTIQDLGHKGRRYPFRLMFSGADHDTEADAFEATLLEQGTGVLEHPRYGQIDVVPVGKISQRDDLVTRANQTVIEVTFVAVLGSTYPAAQTDATQMAVAAVSEYQAAAASEFADRVDTSTQLEEVTLRDQWADYLAAVSTNLAAVADLEDDIAAEFDAQYDSVNSSIDVLIDAPLTLATQTLGLINTPAQSADLVDARVDAYADLASSIITSGSTRISSSSDNEAVTITSTNDSRAVNELAARQIYAEAAVAGAVTAAMTAVSGGEYKTQTQAITAAENLLDLMDTVRTWLEGNYAALNGTGTNNSPTVDTGGGYQKLLEAVAYASGALIQSSFGLIQERSVTLTSPRSIFDFVAEWYGEVDDKLDYFIETNDLTGSEILELPRGKTVVVYV